MLVAYLALSALALRPGSCATRQPVTAESLPAGSELPEPAQAADEPGAVVADEASTATPERLAARATAGHAAPSALAEMPPAAAAMPAPSDDSLEQSFAAQAVDLEWSASARRQILERLAPSLHGHGRLESVECHSTLCRVEASYVDAREYEAWLSTTSYRREESEESHSLWRGEIAVRSITPDPESGSPLAIMYLARPAQGQQDGPLAPL